MDYEIRRRLFGGQTVVAYRCPGCAAELESPLTEAGEIHSCPFCEQLILTPGLDELQEQVREEAKAQATKRLAESTARELKRVKAAAPPKMPKPPVLVWYGEMRCNRCGYYWKSRRPYPPAKATTVRVGASRRSSARRR